MKPKQYILAFLFLTGIFAAAPVASAAFGFQTGEVSVEIVGGDSLTVDPGAVVTVVYRVSSDSDEIRSFDAGFDIPAGWSIIFGTDAVITNGRTPTTRFVSYKIPANALAADYALVFSLSDSVGTEIGSIESLVTINQVFSIEFESDPVSQYSAAGKRVNASFAVINRGNSPVTVQLKAMGRKFASERLPFSSIELAPKESSTFEAEIQTDANLDHSQRASLRFEARLVQDRDIVHYQTVAFNIVPIYSRIRPKAAPVPLSLSFETVGDESGIIPQARISGQMPLLGGQLSVSATLAQMPRQKFFGADQRFAVEYRREDISVKVGDHSQTISPMTLTGEQGVGVAARIETSVWDIKGTAQRSRYVFPVQKRFAVSAAYKTSDNSFFSVNLLHRIGFYDGSLVTARGVSKPFGSASRLDIECGISSSEALRDPSCSMLISNSTSRFSYRLRGQRASESFPGTMTGIRQISEYMSFRINSKFRLDNSLRITKRALGSGFERSNSFFKAGITYTNRLAGGTLYVTSHGVRSQAQYSSLQSVVTRSESAIRTTLVYHFRAIGLTISLEEGYAQSSEGQSDGSLRRFKSNARVSPLRGLSLNVSFESSAGNLSALSFKQSQRQFGLGSTLSLKKGMSASIVAFRSTIQTSIQQQYSSLRLRVNKNFRSGRTLSVQMQFNHSSGRSDLRTSDYRISYTMPLELPFGSHTENTEFVRGRVIDIETGAPVPGVLLFLGDKLAISDDSGRFGLPRPELSIEFLRVDQNSIGFDRVTVIPMPLEVGPNDFPDGELLIQITKAARVIGSIDVFSASGVDGHLLGNEQVDLAQDGGLAGAVLEIKSETHRFRTRTGKTGKFEFNQLPPGSYSVEIIRYNLGDRQRINQTTVNVELELGATKIIQFKVVPTRKRIRMIQSVSLSMGESKGKAESEDVESDGSVAAPGALPNDSAAPDSSRTTDLPPSSSSTTGGEDGWFELMLESANEATAAKSAALSTVYLPYYVEISTEPRESRYSALYMALFLFCVLFVLIDIDLFVRRSMSSNRGPIKSIKGSNWIWPARQAVLYALGIWARHFMARCTGTICDIAGPFWDHRHDRNLGDLSRNWECPEHALDQEDWCRILDPLSGYCSENPFDFAGKSEARTS